MKNNRAPQGANNRQARYKPTWGSGNRGSGIFFETSANERNSNTDIPKPRPAPSSISIWPRVKNAVGLSKLPSRRLVRGLGRRFSMAAFHALAIGNIGGARFWTDSATALMGMKRRGPPRGGEACSADKAVQSPQYFWFRIAMGSRDAPAVKIITAAVAMICFRIKPRTGRMAINHGSRRGRFTVLLELSSAALKAESHRSEILRDCLARRAKSTAARA